MNSMNSPEYSIREDIKKSVSEIKYRNYRLKISLLAAVLSLLVGIVGMGVAANFYFEDSVGVATKNAVERAVDKQLSVTDDLMNEINDLNISLKTAMERISKIEREISEPDVWLNEFKIQRSKDAGRDLEGAFEQAQTFCESNNFRIGFPKVSSVGFNDTIVVWCIR